MVLRKKCYKTLTCLQQHLLHHKIILLQILRFGVVGCTAALVNMLVVILLVETIDLAPLLANIFAFLIAFNVSYFGHAYWTFANIHAYHKKSIPKFFLVASTSFILNEGLFFIFLSIFKFYYILALLCVLIIVPLFTFIMSKFWAFHS